jgi:hypothetical protein
MKRKNDNHQPPENESGDQTERLEVVSFKCSPEARAKLRSFMKSMSGDQFACLTTSLLARAGFKLQQASEIAEVQAFKTYLVHLITDFVQRIAATCDELSNQVSASKNDLAQTETEAAAQHLIFETELKAKEAELENLRAKVASLLRENAASSESLQKANKMIALLERENLEKSSEIEMLRTQIGLESKFSGLENELRGLTAEIKDKMGAQSG